MWAGPQQLNLLFSCIIVCQILDIPHNPDKALKLELDPEWLCILKATNHLLNLNRGNSYMPGLGCSERSDSHVPPTDFPPFAELKRYNFTHLVDV